MTCQKSLILAGKPYPRTCSSCGFGPCKEIAMDLYGIVTTNHIYHEGDERSRTNPGHGYPAHTESVESLTYVTGADALKEAIERMDKRGEAYKIYKLTPVTVTKTVSFDIK